VQTIEERSAKIDAVCSAYCLEDPNAEGTHFMSDDKTLQNFLSYIPGRRHDILSIESPGLLTHAIPLAAGAAVWQVIAAHALTLLELEVIDEPGFNALARSIDATRASVEASGLPLRALMADLTERIDGTVPAEFAGAIVLGLAREEWLATAGRLAWRHALTDVISAVMRLQQVLLALSEAHTITIMPAFAGGRATQPTNFGHLLGGLIAPLQSGTRRLQAAFGAINRSPLGAGMLAGEIIVSERDHQASILGFDSPIANTLEAVMSVEDMVEATDAIGASLAPVRRFLGELISWIRSDPTSFVLTPEWQTRPEPVNPLLWVPEQIDLLIQDVRDLEDRAHAFGVRLRDAAYGPVGALATLILTTAGELNERIPTTLDRTGHLLSEGVMINRAYLGNRSGRAHTTGGDLAGFLMTEEALPPSAARGIASMVLGQLEAQNLEVSGITQDMIDSAAMMTIGREIKVEMETLGRYLAPRRFLERRQVTGSPAASMTREWIGSVREQVDEDAEWLATRRAGVDRAISALESTIAEAATVVDE